MYDLRMHNTGGDEVEIIADRLTAGLELRRMKPAQLARLSGVDKSTISMIMSGLRPNTPAVIVAKLATALDMSVDYLVGLSDEPEPRQLDLGEIVLELTRVARQLTSRRQRDLLMTARAYLEASDQLKADPDLLMDNVLDLIKEAGGEASRDQLLDLLNSAGPLGGGPRAIDDDTEEPPESDE
jgi:transcriptional regulator with XRE-family HTH domain